MTCFECGHENVSGAAFCAQCGSRLGGPAQGSPYRPFDARQPGDATRRLPRRDLGSLISETFNVFSGNFWPFALIGAGPAIPLIISSATPTWLSVILTVVSLVATLLAFPAATYGVALHYLGQEVDVADCYRRAWNRVVSIIFASLLWFAAVVCAALLSLILIGVPLLFFILVSFFFFEQAIILERLGPVGALRRSAQLVTGSRWRVLGIGTVYMLLMLALGLGALIVTGIVLTINSIAGNVVANVFEIFLFPIVPIGATLVYFDLRVRNEGYDLDTMAAEVGPGTAIG